jgi:glycosyltransferase involved in cell wall biosynthesis
MRHGHDITILEPFGPWKTRDETLVKVQSYRDICLFGHNLGVFRDFNTEFVSLLSALVRKGDFDIIQISSPSGAVAAKIAKTLLNRRTCLVYDAHNFESEFVKETSRRDRNHSLLERIIVSGLIRVLNHLACHFCFDFLICVSGRDRDLFIDRLRLDPKRVFMVPIGTHIIDLPTEEAKSRARQKFGIGKDRIVIVFHGLYTHPPNKEAFDLIVKSLAPRFADVDGRVLFVLGGTDSPSYSKENVLFCGFIENLFEFLSLADIAVVPLRHGGGVKVKVLDYLGMGIPIISTKKGVEGIDVIDGENALVVDGVEGDLIDRIQFLVHNQDERARLGRNARELALSKYDWTVIGNMADDVVRRITEVSRSG